MIEYLVAAFNVVNMDLSCPYPRRLLDCTFTGMQEREEESLRRPIRILVDLACDHT